MSLIPHKVHSYTRTPLPIYPAADGQKTVNHYRIVTVSVHLTSDPNP